MSAFNSHFVIDLDDTICFPNHDKSNAMEKYGLAKPNQPVIDVINSLHDKGYIITILTARRMLTHAGDMEKIIEDVGDITKDWLAKHKVKYDTLLFGKPYAKLYYVDDKNITIDQFIELGNKITNDA